MPIDLLSVYFFIIIMVHWSACTLEHQITVHTVYLPFVMYILC